MSVTYSVCVFIAPGTQREMCMCHCHLWRVRGLLYFFHISLTARYSGGIHVAYRVCFDFLYNFFCETFLIRRRIEREIIKIVYLPSCKVPVIHIRF